MLLFHFYFRHINNGSFHDICFLGYYLSRSGCIGTFSTDVIVFCPPPAYNISSLYNDQLKNVYLATDSSPSELYEIDVDSGNASFITTLLISNPTTLFKNLSNGYLTYYYTIYDSGYYTLYSVTNSVVTVVDTQFNGTSLL